MGKRKKKHPRAEPDAEADSKVPRSFVFKSGRVGKAVAHLVQDMRKVMLPYTAERLQVRPSLSSAHTRALSSLDSSSVNLFLFARSVL